MRLMSDVLLIFEHADLVRRHGGHLGIGVAGQQLGIGDGRFGRFELVVGGDDFFQLSALAADLLQPGWVGGDGRIGEELVQLLISAIDIAEGFHEFAHQNAILILERARRESPTRDRAVRPCSLAAMHPRISIFSSGMTRGVRKAVLSKPTSRFVESGANARPEISILVPGVLAGDANRERSELLGALGACCSFPLRHGHERELEIPWGFDRIRFDLADHRNRPAYGICDVLSRACQRATNGGIASSCLFYRNDLYSIRQEVFGFPSQRRIPTHHDGRNAQIPEDRRIQTELSVRSAVQTQFGDHTSGNRVGMDGGGRGGHGVVANTDRGIECLAVGAFQLAVVLGIAAAGNQMRHWMQIFDQDISHGPMTIVDQDVIGIDLTQPLDSRIDILSHQPATDRIVWSLRHHEVAVDDPADAFDISADEYVQLSSFP